jgi:hypothetical protein
MPCNQKHHPIANCSGWLSGGMPVSESHQLECAYVNYCVGIHRHSDVVSVHINGNDQLGNLLLPSGGPETEATSTCPGRGATISTSTTNTYETILGSSGITPGTCGASNLPQPSDTRSDYPVPWGQETVRYVYSK